MNMDFNELQRRNATLKELQHLQEQGFNIKEIEQGLTISKMKDESPSAEEIIHKLNLKTGLNLLDKESK